MDQKKTPYLDTSHAVSVIEFVDGKRAFETRDEDSGIVQNERYSNDTLNHQINIQRVCYKN